MQDITDKLKVLADKLDDADMEGADVLDETIQLIFTMRREQVVSKKLAESVLLDIGSEKGVQH